MKTVECAFMGVTAPTVDEGIERCVLLGAKKGNYAAVFPIHWYFNGTHANDGERV